jgi:hypothetical protein
MVQAENIQAALEMCGVLDLGKIPRRDMETHADVDYIYVEEPTGAVIDPVITRGTTTEQKHVTVLHNFADRFVASQKPLPPEDYAILEQAVQEEFDKCEKEPEICKAIYYHIKHGIDDSSDLMDCYDGLEVHRLIEKFFATYFPVATVTIIAFDKDYIHYEEERPKWVGAYFSSEPGIKYRLDFIVRENDENNMVLRAEDSDYKNIASIGLDDPTKFGETLESLKQKVDALRNPPTEASPEIRTVGDLKAIIAGLPDNYVVTLGSDYVAVPSHGTYDHGAYEVDSDVSRITTLHVNPDRRELYVGVDITLNNLRV